MCRLLLVIWTLFPLAGLGQYTLSGRVLNKADKTPVASASIFLNNTLVGGRTADNGAFLLTNVKSGQYDLVITCIGFETLSYHCYSIRRRAVAGYGNRAKSYCVA